MLSACPFMQPNSSVRPFYLQDRIETPNIPESAKISVSRELMHSLLDPNAARQVLEPRSGAGGAKLVAGGHALLQFHNAFKRVGAGGA
jgi:hypothetical protein